MLALGLLVAGCYQAPILYMPPSANLPLVKGAGEGDISVLADIYGFTARAGWSPLDHLQIFGLATHYDSRPDSSRHVFHSYQEAGAAWYTSIGTSTVFSLTAGYGRGYAIGFGVEFWSNDPWLEASGSYNRAFAGFGIGYTGRVDTMALIQYREFGLAVRVARVDFPGISGLPDTDRGEGWYIEPVFVSRGGERAVQLETQIGFTFVESSTGIEAMAMFASIGLRMQLDRMF